MAGIGFQQHFSAERKIYSPVWRKSLYFRPVVAHFFAA